MGKSKKTNNDPLISKPIALVDQLTGNQSVKLQAREKKRKRKDEDDEFVGGKESKKILKQAREQLNEIETADDDNHDKKTSKAAILKNPLLSTTTSKDSDNDDDDEDNDDNINDSDEVDEELDEEVKKQFEKFFTGSDQKKMADDILEAISSKRTEIESQFSDTTSLKTELSEDLVKLFKGVGQVLSAHRHGPVPKPLKIIPKYRIWEELLELTEPDKWSAAAVLAATRIFVSNLKDKQVARYARRVLLPRIRDDIREFKRLNDHLYEALIKCMFKSYGFIKGFLLPLCKEGDCSAREATIVSSVLARSSIKMEHSAAAMMEMCQMAYSPAICIFLTTLMDKKYALPYVVVDELVNYFLRFQTDRQDLPVLWHQCLLTFAQRYKQDVSSEQKEALLQLLKSHPHRDISPEIRHELVNAKCRDIEVLEPPLSSVQDME